MERDPHSLLEGMILAGYALGVRTAYIYVRGEMLPQIRSLNAAIKECYDAGLLGENIARSILWTSTYTVALVLTSAVKKRH